MRISTAKLLSELDASFPATWRDYRWVSRRVVEAGPELNEWLRALRGYPADALEKAHQKKKDSHDFSWLVLMLMKATSGGDPWLDEVLDAAATIGRESPAFWTASYYRARLLLDAGRIDAARQLLDTLPAEDALSLSDHNRFEGLRARAARSAEEFLLHGAMVPVQVGSTDGVRIFSYPGDGLEALRDGRSFFEPDVIATINRYFQPWLLAEGARNDTLPEHLRRELALVAFSRAFVSGDGETVVDVARLASELTPELEPSLAEFRTAGSDSERDFAGALAMLRFPGLGTQPSRRHVARSAARSDWSPPYRQLVVCHRRARGRRAGLHRQPSKRGITATIRARAGSDPPRGNCAPLVRRASRRSTRTGSATPGGARNALRVRMGTRSAKGGLRRGVEARVRHVTPPLSGQSVDGENKVLVSMSENAEQFWNPESLLAGRL